jgi:hypothetical protein
MQQGRVEEMLGEAASIRRYRERLNYVEYLTLLTELTVYDTYKHMLSEAEIAENFLNFNQGDRDILFRLKTRALNEKMNKNFLEIRGEIV